MIGTVLVGLLLLLGLPVLLCAYSAPLFVATGGGTRETGSRQWRAVLFLVYAPIDPRGIQLVAAASVLVMLASLWAIVHLKFGEVYSLSGDSIIAPLATIRACWASDHLVAAIATVEIMLMWVSLGAIVRGVVA